jgi:small subunit ribosomal protein S17
MADEEKNETEEPTPEEEPAAEPEAAAEEPAAEEPEPEPAEQLSSKERRRRARSTHAGEAKPVRTPEERQAERRALRTGKAKRRSARREQERAADHKRRETAGPPAEQPTAEHGPGRPKTRLGIVVSDKADKTITVRIDIARRHRRYQKIVRSSSTLHAHDETNDAHIGDTVRVVESRPLSRTKRWRLVEVLERAK